MKSFLEEYGFAILAAIVIILLIAMASPLGDIIRTQLSNIVNKFANSANKKLDAADAGDASAVLAGSSLSIIANSTTDRFTAVLHWVEGGKDHYGDIDVTAPGTGEYTSKIADVLASNVIKNLDGVTGADAKTATPDKGSEYYVEVKNTGTGDVFFSNRVKKA